MPHTSQRTFVLFAKRRARGERAANGERAMFAISERAGKDAAGAPILRRSTGESARDESTPALDHDLDDVLAALGPFLASEGFVS